MKKIILISLTVFIVSCSDYNYYPKVFEVLTFENETDYKLYYIKKSTLTDNYTFEIERTRSFRTEIYGYEYDLWLSEAQFEDFLSDVKIFRVNNENDTIYIDPTYYRKKTNWTLQTESYHDWGEMKTNYNSLTLTSSMIKAQN